MPSECLQNAFRMFSERFQNIFRLVCLERLQGDPKVVPVVQGIQEIQVQPGKCFSTLWTNACLSQDAVCGTSPLTTRNCWTWHLEINHSLHQCGCCSLQCGTCFNFFLSNASPSTRAAIDHVYHWRTCDIFASSRSFCFRSRRTFWCDWHQVLQSTRPSDSWAATASWAAGPTCPQQFKHHWFVAEPRELGQRLQGL